MRKNYNVPRMEREMLGASSVTRPPRPAKAGPSSGAPAATGLDRAAAKANPAAAKGMAKAKAATTKPKGPSARSRRGRY